MMNQKLDILKRLVEESPLSKADIARRAEIDPNSLSRILSGGNKLNSIKTLEGLAKALDVHPGLFFGDFEMSDFIQRDIVDLPLIVGFSNIDKRGDMITDHIPTPKSMLGDIDIASEETFWVQAVGNAFAPRVRHGDQVLISRASLRSGDLVIAHYPKTNATYLKRYMDYTNRVALIPENPEDHDSVVIAYDEIDEQSVILYKVIRIASIP